MTIQIQWHLVNVSSNTSGSRSKGKKDKDGWHHTFLRITPNVADLWVHDDDKDGRDPKQKEADEAWFFTMGAGPGSWFNSNSLVSDLNRETDRVPHKGKFINVKVPDKYKSEAEFIEKLLELDKNYKDNLDYDLFPELEPDGNFDIAGDGYNSNSYVSGLLLAAGATLPEGSVLPNSPGFEKPVPVQHFVPPKKKPVGAIQ